MPQEAAEEVAWLMSHLRTMVAIAPSSWARYENLTLPQLTALHFIHADGFLTLTSLASALGTRPSTTSAMVDRLAAADMVARHPDPEHGSRVRVLVTAEVAQMLGDVDLRTARRFHAVLQMLSPKQQQDVSELLGDLVWQRLLTRAGRSLPRRKRRARR